MAHYRKIYSRIWNDEKFSRLSDDGKLAFLFLLTHPFMTCLGAMRATFEGLAAELGWDTTRFKNAVAECHPMLVVIETERLFLFPNFLRFNQPQSQNSIIGPWPHALSMLPEGQGKRTVIAKCLEYLETCSQKLRDTLPETLIETLRQGLAQGQRQGQRHTPVYTLTHSGEGKGKGRGIREEPPLGAPPLPPPNHCPKPSPKPSPKRKLPDDFDLTLDRRDFAINVGVSNPDREFAQFTDHFRGSAEPKADWEATWRKWCRNAAPGGAYAKRSGNHDQLPASRDEHIASIKRDLESRRARQTTTPSDEDAF